MAYDKFENLKRPDIVDYIDKVWEIKLNNQVKHFDMELLTGVLAYKVFLKNANISNEKQQLIQTTIIASYIQ